MSDYMENTCKEFIQLLASKEATPGGGGASALVGCIGIALGNMVGSLTVGKKKYISVQADILKLKEQADKLQLELLALVEEDAKAFSPLAKAYGLPANTEEEKQEKAIVMEKALHNACAVPFKIMEKCCVAINIIHGFADKGSKIAISDAGCGVICCKAALKAASLNVFINTKLMKNKEYAQKINLQVENMLNTYIPEADKIYTQVENQVKN